jgi:hypothetical protein
MIKQPRSRNNRRGNGRTRLAFQIGRWATRFRAGVATVVGATALAGVAALAMAGGAQAHDDGKFRRPARAGGCNAWQTFPCITLPFLSPVIAIAITIRSLHLGRVTTNGRTELFWTPMATVGFPNARMGAANVRSLAPGLPRARSSRYLHQGANLLWHRNRRVLSRRRR